MWRPRFVIAALSPVARSAGFQNDQLASQPLERMRDEPKIVPFESLFNNDVKVD